MTAATGSNLGMFKHTTSVADNADTDVIFITNLRLDSTVVAQLLVCALYIRYIQFVRLNTGFEVWSSLCMMKGYAKSK